MNKDETPRDLTELLEIAKATGHETYTFVSKSYDKLSLLKEQINSLFNHSALQSSQGLRGSPKPLMEEVLVSLALLDEGLAQAYTLSKESTPKVIEAFTTGISGYDKTLGKINNDFAKTSTEIKGIAGEIKTGVKETADEIKQGVIQATDSIQKYLASTVKDIDTSLNNRIQTLEQQTITQATNIGTLEEQLKRSETEKANLSKEMDDSIYVQGKKIMSFINLFSYKNSSLQPLTLNYADFVNKLISNPNYGSLNHFSIINGMECFLLHHGKPITFDYIQSSDETTKTDNDKIFLYNNQIKSEAVEQLTFSSFKDPSFGAKTLLGNCILDYITGFNITKQDKAKITILEGTPNGTIALIGNDYDLNTSDKGVDLYFKEQQLSIMVR